jgi:hypothetical protein
LFDPHSTVVLADGLDFRHPDYYLRDYQLTSLSYTMGESSIALPGYIHHLVLFSDNLITRFSSNLGFQRVLLPNGGVLYYLSWEPGRRALLTQKRIEISE